MLKFKSLFVALSLFFLTSFAYAGEMNAIDLEVRETIANEYAVDHQENRLEFDLQKDIWGLKLLADESPACLVMVEGFAKKVIVLGGPTYKFWVCINKNGPGNYDGELFDDMLVDS